VRPRVVLEDEYLEPVVVRLGRIRDRAREAHPASSISANAYAPGLTSSTRSPGGANLATASFTRGSDIPEAEVRGAARSDACSSSDSASRERIRDRRPAGRPRCPPRAARPRNDPVVLSPQTATARRWRAARLAARFG
jgi:hypothetical protein